jgi:hypothetical protein
MPSSARTARATLVCVALTLLANLLLCKPCDAAEPTSGSLAVRSAEGVVHVEQDGRTIMQYAFDNVPAKPYVQTLATPAGRNLLRDAPADHLHHHGLMLALRVDGVNFWEEHGEFGWQKHLGFTTQRATMVDGRDEAVLVENLAWLTAGGKELLREVRTLTLANPSGDGPRVLTWQSVLSPGADAGETVTIDGRRYYGLGVRMIPPMDAAEGRHFNAAGGEGVAETNEHRAGWSAYAAPAESGDSPTWATLAMFDPPTNPRHPADWFTMGEGQHFAYVAATLALDEEPIELKPGQRLSLRYGVALFDGRVGAAPVEAAYRAWRASLD